jgi:hypothetical protein
MGENKPAICACAREMVRAREPPRPAVLIDREMVFRNETGPRQFAGKFLALTSAGCLFFAETPSGAIWLS